MMPLRALLAPALLAAGLAQAQPAADWGDLGALLTSTLTASGTAEAAYWLPNSPSPADATEAVGVVYEYIPGSAGNTSIAIGLFRRAGDQFTLAGMVEGIYGQDPGNSAFYPDRIELSTTTLKDDDPRCCPTGSSRWAIDRTTLAVRQIQ